MARWDAFIRMYRELGGVTPNIERPIVPRERHPQPASGLLAETEEAAIGILSDAGRPMPTRELLEALSSAAL